MRILLACGWACLAAFHSSAQSFVVGWGDNTYGQLNPPSSLSNVMAIAAGEGFYSLALQSNGTVVAWGFGSGSAVTNVPAGLSSVAAIAAGGFHGLALKSNGTVVAWGTNTYHQTNVPVGLSNAVAIAAGRFHSLALKSDGTVVAWGRNDFGQTNVPSGLSNVVAVAAGASNSLALKSNGTIVPWGNNTFQQTNVPAGLSGVAAIVGGDFHSLALKSNGTVVAWGNDSFGQTNVPAGLSNVVAVAAGFAHNLALKNNGTVVAWGSNYNNAGQTNVPLGLSNVVAVAAGELHSLALTNPLPLVILCPGNLTVAGFTNVPPPDTNSVVVSNACGTVSVTLVNTTTNFGTCTNTIYRTYQAVDSCNRTKTCTQIISVTVINGTPSVTISALCPATNGIPGGVLGFSGQVCNTGNIPMTNVTVFDNRVLITGTNLVATYPLLTNGECRTFSGSFSIPPTVTNSSQCSISHTLSAFGTNICNLASFATSTAITNCPLQLNPRLAVAKLCPPTNGVPGGVIGFCVTVTNVGNVSVTNIAVVNNQPVAGTPVGAMARLDPGQGTTLCGTEPVPTNVCWITDVVTASGRDICNNFVFSSATNTCPVRTMPGLAIVGICPSSKVVSGDTFGFTVCITNIGNVSLTNITITNCVGSGTPQAGSCAQLTTISRLDPNQSACVSRTEGPVFDGVSSVPNFGTASARDVCGNPVSVNYATVCPICTLPVVTQPPYITSQSIFPDGLHVTVCCFADFATNGSSTYFWYANCPDTNCTNINPLTNSSTPCVTVVLSPSDETTNVTVRVNNGCGFGSGSGGVNTCAFCVTRGSPVLQIGTNGSFASPTTNIATCGRVGATARWFKMSATNESGLVTISTEGSLNQPALAIYYGPLLPGQLSLVACSTSAVSRVSFMANKSATYWVVVDPFVTNPTLRVASGFEPYLTNYSLIKTDRSFEVYSTIAPAITYRLLATTNLGTNLATVLNVSNWTTLLTTNLSNFPYLHFRDTNVPALRQRFYRLAAP